MREVRDDSTLGTLINTHIIQGWSILCNVSTKLSTNRKQWLHLPGVPGGAELTTLGIGARDLRNYGPEPGQYEVLRPAQVSASLETLS